MGGTQTKKKFEKGNEERISQLEQSIKVLGDDLASSNTNQQIMCMRYESTKTSIDTLETATAVLGTNLKSTNDKVDSLTKCVETMTSKMDVTNNRTERLYTQLEHQTDRIDGLIAVMQKTEETKAKDVNLLSSILQNISQFGQAPVNCNFVTRISHGSTESEIQTHT